MEITRPERYPQEDRGFQPRQLLALEGDSIAWLSLDSHTGCKAKARCRLDKVLVKP